MDIDLETGDLKLYPVKPRIILILQNFKWTRNEVSIVFSFGFVGIMDVFLRQLYKGCIEKPIYELSENGKGKIVGSIEVKEQGKGIAIHVVASGRC